MTDSTNTEPPAPLRESLITTAVAFLKNEKVKGSPLEEKKAFLHKKGLTTKEIEESIKIFNNPSNLSPDLSTLAPPPPSTLSSISSTFSTIVLVAGSSYALYHLYQKFLKPLIFGEQKSQENEVLEQLLSNSRMMNHNLVAMIATLNDLHIQMARSNSQLLLNDSSQDFRLATNEMREEIRSLKALLLSRNQFPSAPSTQAPSLPAWQISAENNKFKNPSFTPNGDPSDEDEDEHDEESKNVNLDKR